MLFPSMPALSSKPRPRLRTTRKSRRMYFDAQTPSDTLGSSHDASPPCCACFRFAVGAFSRGAEAGERECHDVRAAEQPMDRGAFDASHNLRGRRVGTIHGI